METTHEPAGTPATPAKPKAKVSPTRNILGLILLLVFGTVFFFEISAVRGFNSAVQAIEAKLPKEDPKNPTAQLPELPSQVEIEKIIGRPADGPPVREGAETKLVYTWKGLIKTFKLKAYYSNGSNPSLVRIDTEQEEAAKK